MSSFCDDRDREVSDRLGLTPQEDFNNIRGRLNNYVLYLYRKSCYLEYRVWAVQEHHCSEFGPLIIIHFNDIIMVFCNWFP
jgi:hypothetical protein